MSILSALLGPLLDIVGRLAAPLVAYFKGRADARQAARLDQAERTAEAAKARQEVDDEVVRGGLDAARERLRDWAKRP